MKFNTTKSDKIVSEEEQYFMDELNKINIDILMKLTIHMIVTFI